MVIAPATTGSVPGDVPPTALAVEPPPPGGATFDAAVAPPPLPDEAQASTDESPRILTPEERARIIAELEALARRQSEY